VRSPGRLVRRLAACLLHDPRPDDPEPAGGGCRDPVSLRDLLSHTRAAGRGRAGDRGAATRARVGRRHRHGAQAARVVLSGRGVPPRLLPSQPEPGVLQRGDRAQGGEGPEALSGQVETAGVSRFTDALVVTPLADGTTWVIVRAFGYDVGSEGSGDHIEVAIGFQTDFATIPRPFWVILPKCGRYGNASVIHDWLYWTQTRPRRQAESPQLRLIGPTVPQEPLASPLSLFRRHRDAVPVQDPVGREGGHRVARRDDADEVERVGAAQRDERTARLLAAHLAEE